jgi:hypothetical protein
MKELTRALTPARLRLLALCSALATGVVVWVGLNHHEPNTLAAALVHREAALRASSAALAATAGQPAPTSTTSAGSTSKASSAESSSGGEGESESSSSHSSSKSKSSTSSASASSSSGSTPSPPASEPPSSSSQHQSTRPPTSVSRGVSTTAPRATAIKHVFVIVLSSPGYEQTWGPASPARYLTTQLRPQGTLLTDYYAIGHADLPNYIAMISGQPPNPQTAADCTTFAEFPPGGKVNSGGVLPGAGCVYPVEVLTLADQLTSSRRAWRAYLEDLANGPHPVQACRHPNSNQPDETQRGRPGDGYATRHNPFVYFHSLLDLGDCASDDLPLTQLSADLASPAKAPNFAFIAPNLCHDGSEAPCADGQPGGLAAADAFLKQWVPQISRSPAYRRDGLLVITFADGPASDTSGCCQTSSAAGAGFPSPPAGGGRIGALLLSRYVKPGGTSATPYNHYSLLRTIEDLFGLPHLAEAGGAGVRSFGRDVFKGVFGRK